MKNPAHRLALTQSLGLTKSPVWLHQTHSTDVIKLATGSVKNAADAAWTTETGLPCVVLTADCLPILLTDSQGSFVAAIHCGWRGLLGGIIENTVKAVQHNSGDPILAWLGPAIGPQSFEVGDEVCQQFRDQDYTNQQAFVRTSKPGKWMGDLYQLAKLRLRAQGITQIYGGDRCTVLESDTLFSHRKNDTGRMATMIWLAPL
jgi:hypothetical protein